MLDSAIIRRSCLFLVLSDVRENMRLVVCSALCLSVVVEDGDHGFLSNDYFCMSVVMSSISRSTVDGSSATFDHKGLNQVQSPFKSCSHEPLPHRLLL